MTPNRKSLQNMVAAMDHVVEKLHLIAAEADNPDGDLPSFQEAMYGLFAFSRGMNMQEPFKIHFDDEEQSGERLTIVFELQYTRTC
jgi:hypothetical protein